MKENQEKFSWNCFSSQSTPKERRDFIDNMREEENKKLPKIAAVKKRFEGLINDDKKVPNDFNLIFSNLGQHFSGSFLLPSFSAGD